MKKSLEATLKDSEITLEQFFEFVKKTDTETFNNPSSHSKNTIFYLNKFRKHGHKKFFLSLNWPFFFFDTTWLIYRKMYWAYSLKILYSIYMLSLLVFSTIFPNAITKIYTPHSSTELANNNVGTTIYLFMIFAYIMFILSNFTGNMIYFYHIRHYIRKKNHNKQGVSKIAVFISYILLTLNICLTFLVGKNSSIKENIINNTVNSQIEYR